MFPFQPRQRPKRRDPSEIRYNKDDHGFCVVLEDVGNGMKISSSSNFYCDAQTVGPTQIVSYEYVAENIVDPHPIDQFPFAYKYKGKLISGWRVIEDEELKEIQDKLDGEIDGIFD